MPQTKVFCFKVRMPDETELSVLREIRRGREYYNKLIDDVNARRAGALEGAKEVFGQDFDESLLFLPGSYTTAEGPKKMIPSVYSRYVMDVCVDNPPGESGSYKGTYDKVCLDFQQAMSAKRVGVWPGEPYRRRLEWRHDGAIVGVRFSPTRTWAALRDGKREICSFADAGHFLTHSKRGVPLTQAREGTWKVLRLKVAKDEPPVSVYVKMRHRGRCQPGIPDDAVISRVFVVRSGDYAQGNRWSQHRARRYKWTLQITATVPDTQVSESAGRLIDRSDVGVDIGWQVTESGSLLVAQTSDGVPLVVPPYVVRMAYSQRQCQADRQALADAIRQKLPTPTDEGAKLPKSPEGISIYIQREGVKGEEFDAYVKSEHELHCREDHLRRRIKNIRTDHYRKFSHQLTGRKIVIAKSQLKQIAEEQNETGWLRFIASPYSLVQLLKNKGACEVDARKSQPKESAEISHGPSVEAAKQLIGLTPIERSARKAVRKYRKYKASPEAPQDAQATA